MTTKISAAISLVRPVRHALARFALRFPLATAVGAGAFAPCAARAFDLSDRGALWQVVHKLCLPMHSTLGLPLPCLAVDDQHGFVVIRAPGDATRIIVVPTVRMEGIESPSLLRDDSPNYWAYAWNERGRVAAAAPHPLGWDDIGMAINSRLGRTQDQMHIHVDCLDARLKKALAGAKLSTQRWSTLNLKPWGRYRVKRLPENGLERDVFQTVAKEIPGARTSMGLQTIAVAGVTGAKGERGFALLDKGAGGSAEELLDHQCRAERR
ncbi:MAG TPA: CDP-diacylglycerol diphosphatase [Methylocystis sp.]|nr:CDP-diacylglycerol diphosphatase [Methylocystis sp.]